jgi:hypothetical protein
MTSNKLKKAAIMIGYLIGAWWLLFSILSQGLTLPEIPKAISLQVLVFSEFFIGGIILILTQVGSKWEKQGGWLLIAYSIFTFAHVITHTVNGKYVGLESVLRFIFLASAPLVIGIMFIESVFVNRPKKDEKIIGQKTKNVLNKKKPVKKATKKKAIKKVTKKKSKK